MYAKTDKLGKAYKNKEPSYNSIELDRKDSLYTPYVVFAHTQPAELKDAISLGEEGSNHRAWL